MRLITDLRAGTPLSPKESVEPTVDDPAERYLREYVSIYTKESTARNYRHILKKSILPKMGNLAVSEVEPRDILSLRYGLSDTPAAANLALDVLKKMFDLAELWEMRPLGGNPCKSVRQDAALTRRRHSTACPQLHPVFTRLRLSRQLDPVQAVRALSGLSASGSHGNASAAQIEVQVADTQLPYDRQRKSDL